MVVIVGDTLMVCVVSPVSQRKLVPPVTVKLADCPKHIIWSGVALATTCPTETVTTSVPVQPCASVAVTLYVVVVAGDTRIVAVFSPLLHTYVWPPEAVKVAVLPSQMLWSGPASTVILPTVTVTSSLSVQPKTSVTVTV